MLVELAMMQLYGLPERHTTIVKRCDMKLDAVHPCAQLMSADGLSCGRIESQARGGGPVRADELRAHTSARAAGMVGQMKAAEADSRPEVRVRSLLPASGLVVASNLLSARRECVAVSREYHRPETG